MCGRLELGSPERIVRWAHRNGLLISNELVLPARFNVAPSTVLPMVVSTPDGLKLGPAVWGYLPGWQSASCPSAVSRGRVWFAGAPQSLQAMVPFP